MKKLIIEKIVIENWCCFDSLIVKPGDILTATGDNETGKSRLGSAITWVFSGKDIDGNVMNEVVPINGDQSVSPSVTLEMVIENVDGSRKPVTIQKIFKAKFNRDKLYTGEHENTFLLNDGKSNQKKLNEWIAENICNVEVFQMLSNVKTFTENLKVNSKESIWQIQRRIITEILGGLPKEYDIAKSKPAYDSLVDGILRHDKSAIYLKQVKENLADLQKDIEDYPVALSTLQDQQLDTSVELEEEIGDKTFKEAIIDKQQELEALRKENQDYRESQIVKSSSDHTEKIKVLMKEKQDLQNSHYEAVKGKRLEREKLQKEFSIIERQIMAAKDSINKKVAKLDQAKAKEVSTNCTLCGADLDKEKVANQQEIKEKFIADLEKQIADEKAEGSKLVPGYKAKKAAYESFNTEVESPARLEEIDKEINDLQTVTVVPKEINDLPDYAEKMNIINIKIDNYRRQDEIIERNEHYDERIKELSNKHTKNLEERSKMQSKVDLLKKFMKEYCQLVEGEADKLFSGTNVSFKMFKINKSNDELRETFEIYFHGKEYFNQLSLSTRIIVSHLITKSLQNAYGVSVPIVLDNMESVAKEPILATLETQAMFLVRREENCPQCGDNNVRKDIDGQWNCQCGNSWVKKLEIS